MKKQGYVAGMFWRMQRQLKRASKVLAPHGLTLAEFFVLDATVPDMDDWDDAPTPADIARLLGVAAPSTHTIVRKLTDDGLLQRAYTPGTHKGRGAPPNRVVATDKGYEVYLDVLDDLEKLLEEK